MKFVFSLALSKSYNTNNMYTLWLVSTCAVVIIGSWIIAKSTSVIELIVMFTVEARHWVHNYSPHRMQKYLA